jgi:hypothetical protein
MTFSDFVRGRGQAQYTTKSLTELFVDEYLVAEFVKQFGFLKDKDYAAIDALRVRAKGAFDGAGTPGEKKAALQQLLADLDAFAVDLALRLGRRQLKSKAEKDGRIALANAATNVQAEQRIHGDRVLHFTTAFAAIVASDKLRISQSSDQGCVFCIPARYAPYIAQEAPSRVKQMFDIRQDLSHYIEFNLEDSRGFESFNSHIDDSLKGQKELKVSQEILQLSRRDPQWYEWKGALLGGWALVPGPYRWGVPIG